MKKLLILFLMPYFAFLFYNSDQEKYTDIPALDTANHHSGLYLPAGFTATVWAESPQFYNPTNMDVDVKGRIWVTEAVNYRNYNNDPAKTLHHPQGDRIMILEDTDGDGKADLSKVFVEDKDLVSPLGIAVIGNQVIVSCAPSIIIYTDTDGDDKPDSKEVFLTGFGGKDHDHSLHSLIAGPDGKWYFNVGNAGPHHVTDKSGWTLNSGSIYTGGSPYNLNNSGGLKSDDGKVWVGGLALRIGDDGRGLEVVGHNFRNAYELAVDSYGNMWQSDNDDQVVTCRTSFLMEGANAGYFSADGKRYWQADQRPGQSMFNSHWHQDDPGVMPAGDNTGAGSPTGMVVYEGDAFGKQYRGMLLSCEAGKNVVYAYKPKVKGAGFDLNRKNFISTLKTVNEDYKWDERQAHEGKWFRPSDIAVGTDGALYIADWFDPVVGGHAMDDKKGYGRIYRITPSGKQLKSPKIKLNNVKGQIQALLNPAINVRNAGFKKLKAQGEKILPQIRALLKSDNPYHQARAVWLMAELGEKGKQEVLGLLKHHQENIRLTAFRALKSDAALLTEIWATLAADPSAAVRREALISMRNFPEDEVVKLIGIYARLYDGIDPWYLNAIGIASRGKEEAVYNHLKSIIGDEDALLWSKAFSAIVWEIHPSSAVKDLKRRADHASLPEVDREKAVTSLAFINSEESVKSMIALKDSPLKDVRAQAGFWVDFRKSNDWYSLYNWSANEQGEASVNLESKKNQDLLALLLNSGLPLNKRIDAAMTLAKSVEGGKILIQMAVKDELGDEIKTAVAETIINNPDQGVSVLASDYFSRSAEKMTFSTKAIAKMQGVAEAGKVLFAKKCASCHKIVDVGNPIGPDLTNIHRKFNQTALLDAIINPSASIAFGYEPWLITMENGTVHYGFMLSDGNTIVIKELNGEQRVLEVNKVKEKKQLAVSIMPAPAGLALSDKDLADLSTYLLSFSHSE